MKNNYRIINEKLVLTGKLTILPIDIEYYCDHNNLKKLLRALNSIK